MAIAFNAATDGYANSTSVTFAHTTSGSDRFLVVGIKLYGNDDITSVTYNGVAMTHVATRQLSEGHRCVMYGLIAPASGANNVVISRSSSNHIVANATSYTGVSQTGQPEASGTTQATASTISPSATVTSSNAWLVGVAAAAFVGGAFQNQSGSTVRIDNNDLLTGLCGSYDSAGVVGTGSQSLTMGIGSSVDTAGVVAVLAPETGAAGQPTSRRWGGVPYMGGQQIGHKGGGRMWGRTRSGIIVPRRFQEAA